MSLRRKKKLSVDGRFMEGSWTKYSRYPPRILIKVVNFKRNQKKEF
jgi:hypothetical protein